MDLIKTIRTAWVVQLQLSTSKRVNLTTTSITRMTSLTQLAETNYQRSVAFYNGNKSSYDNNQLNDNNYSQDENITNHFQDYEITPIEDERKTTNKKLCVDVAFRIKYKIVKGVIDSGYIIIFIKQAMLEVI